MYKIQINCIVSFILILSTIHYGGSNHTVQKNYQAIKIADHVVMDGNLEENIWNFTPISNFTQAVPSEGAPASEPTDVWIAYDENAIYVAAKLYDHSPENIDASLARRDTDMASDWFYFYVDHIMITEQVIFSQ